jgi:hypothetical protein
VALAWPLTKADGTLAMAWKAWGGCGGKISEASIAAPPPRLPSTRSVLVCVSRTDYDIDVAIALDSSPSYAQIRDRRSACSDVTLPGDPGPRQEVRSCFYETKSQRPQTVAIDGSFQQALLRLQLRRVRRDHPRRSRWLWFRCSILPIAVPSISARAQVEIDTRLRPTQQAAWWRKLAISGLTCAADDQCAHDTPV